MIKVLPRVKKSTALITNYIPSFKYPDVRAVLESLEIVASKTNLECNTALGKAGVGGLTLRESTKGGLARRMAMNGRPERPTQKISLANGTVDSYLRDNISICTLPRIPV